MKLIKAMLRNRTIFNNDNKPTVQLAIKSFDMKNMKQLIQLRKGTA